MKFGKVLEDEIVPEWRLKYLNYRLAKKRLKAVGRAIRNANRTPASVKGSTPADRPPELRAPVYNFLSTNRPTSSDDEEAHIAPGAGETPANDHKKGSGAIAIPKSAVSERSPLAQHSDNAARDRRGMTRYGSIIGTPPDGEDALERTRSMAPSLHLPGPAIDAAQNASPVSPRTRPAGERQGSATSVRTVPHDSAANPKQRQMSHQQRLAGIFHPKRTNSMPLNSPDSPRRPLTARILSLRPGRTVHFASPEEMPMEAYKDIEARQREFYEFLDEELKKIDDFYREKEEEATKRLQVLRDQLHIMRDRRMEEVTRADNSKSQSQRSNFSPSIHANGNGKAPVAQKTSTSKNSDASWLKPFDKAVDKAKLGHVGKTFQAMKDLGTPMGPSAVDLYRDYTKKPVQKDVPYRNAKHKLKIALAEYYRGLELLKSYALLNRTAFRKITKKFDKTVNASPGARYMSEKVAKAHFVNSELIEENIHTIEDLYARYFERGNHKVAVGKLRAKIARAGEFSASAFRNGLLIALGAAFGTEGIIYAAQHLQSPIKSFAVNTQYLLQLYGGFFLAVLLALFFCLACRVWHRNKVNYTFVFEFDTRRQVLDWRQLTELPSILFFLVGLTAWLNFRLIGGLAMYLYWPVVLAGMILAVLFNPLPILYPKSRQWFAYSNWRLLFAGIYPVEFRDFFMGDLFCSQTYALGNLEVFSCLYAQRPPWNKPSICGSSYSRTLGFLTCLPGIWRALQCLRRYKDTRNVFPHLVNCGKYFCTIMQYLSLSLYRMNHTTNTKAFFIACAIVNGIYCSTWDLVMDWSLLDPYAKHRFLRQNLAFKSVYPYYMAIILDPILRFNWIFYAFYTEDPRHAAVVSFMVAFSEVCRRGMWMIFRVENEHCANVGRFRAYRDAPLPYEQASSTSPTLDGRSSESGAEDQAHRHEPSGEQAANLEAGSPIPQHHHSDALPTAPTTGADFRGQVAAAADERAELRRRRGQASDESPVSRALVRAGTMMHLAHTQDFERRRRPEMRDVGQDENGDDADEDDDSDNTETDIEEAALARARGFGSVDAGAPKGR